MYSELHRAAGKRLYTPVSGEHMEQAVNRIEDHLVTMDERNRRFSPLFRDLLARAAVSGDELKRFEGLFAKLAGMSHRRKP